MSTRSIAQGIDTITRAQNYERRIGERALRALVEKHPELASDHNIWVLQAKLSADGPVEKTINDLRHLARESYAEQPEERLDGKHYCERKKANVELDLLWLHKEECFLCDGRDEGIHGTRQVEAYVYNPGGANHGQRVPYPVAAVAEEEEGGRDA